MPISKLRKNISSTSIKKSSSSSSSLKIGSSSSNNSKITSISFDDDDDDTKNSIQSKTNEIDNIFSKQTMKKSQIDEFSNGLDYLDCDDDTWSQKPKKMKVDITSNEKKKNIKESKNPFDKVYAQTKGKTETSNKKDKSFDAKLWMEGKIGTNTNQVVEKSSSISNKVIPVITEPKQGELTPTTSFNLSASTIKSLKERGIEGLFPIQAMSYKPIREGYDFIGRARTGQGKTLAFCLPIYEQLLEKRGKSSYKNIILPKVLIMSPTRKYINILAIYLYLFLL
jgi:hypothetical protein